MLVCKTVAEAMKKRDYQRKQEIKKWKTFETYQTQTRRAKAFVISVMGEFAKTCQSKQVFLNFLWGVVKLDKLYRLLVN